MESACPEAGAGEGGIGRRVSGALDPLSLSDVSYASVVSTNWRKTMRKSRPKSCSLDGEYARDRVRLMIACHKSYTTHTIQ